jgi:Zn-dependent peptidase ImmA (M78 family)
MRTLPNKFKAPYISRENAWDAADKIRSQYWDNQKFPVEVELILQDLSVRVEPSPSLIVDNGADALLLGDFKTIIVDQGEYLDDNMQNRLRFSLAHELGHFVLHRTVFSRINHKNVDEWKKFYKGIDAEQWSLIEYHANEFAGRLLVPREKLHEQISEHARKAKRFGFDRWDASGNAAKDYMSTPLSKFFGVSSRVILIRIDREGLWPPV